jgi:lipopolysaccharide biosynthesis glycosyltransferase
MNIFIGYDSREDLAYQVCAYSINKHQPSATIRPLKLNQLQNSGVYWRDPDPLSSTEFSFSRFLVPYLTAYKGWAIFMDGDMILRDDIANLWNLRDESKAVMVVKHDYKTRMTEKYLGSKNEDYPRKNWSSVILWNCSHPANATITPEFIQNATGAQVHRFSWLPDELIGELPKEWNWLDIEYEWNPLAKLIHYTLGTPCFHEFADKGDFADEWHRERIYTEHCLQHDLPK